MTTRRFLAAALGLALLTAGVFSPAGRFSFVPFDDDVAVTENPLVRGGLSWRGAARAFTTLDEATANWIPLTVLSHMADVSLFGLRPGPHHLVSVALHAAVAGSLAVVLWAMTGRAGLALLVAALLALHPLRVESVAWVAERKDVLSALCWVLAMGAWVRHARRPGPGRYLAAVGAVLLALLAKPMAVTLPLVLLLLDWWPLGRWRGAGAARRLLLEKLPPLLLAAGAALLAWEAQRRAGALHFSDLPHLGLRVANALLSYLWYPGKTAWPAGLSPFYTYHGASLASAAVLAAALALAAATVLAVRLRRSRPWIAVGWAWYLVTLLPVIGLVQVGGQPLADRYSYLPSIGLLLACCWTAGDLLRRGAPAPPRAGLAAAAVAACVALAAATHLQLGHWKDGEALFARARQIAPDHFVLRGLAEYNLGVAAAREGRLAAAEEHFLAAVRTRPAHADAWNNLGGVLVLAGRLAEGERDLREALRLAPRDPKVHANLGLALGGLGRTAEAEAAFSAAIALDPGRASVRFQYGDFLQRLGRTAAAAASFREAVRLDPGDTASRERLAELERAGAAPGAGR
jgi:tetratricopeptide (TPR) repeat protein